jgi:hypothetical protein
MLAACRFGGDVFSGNPPRGPAAVDVLNGWPPCANQAQKRTFSSRSQVKIDMPTGRPTVIWKGTSPSGDCAEGNDFSTKSGFSLTGEFGRRYHSLT